MVDKILGVTESSWAGNSDRLSLLQEEIGVVRGLSGGNGSTAPSDYGDWEQQMGETDKSSQTNEQDI